MRKKRNNRKLNRPSTPLVPSNEPVVGSLDAAAMDAVSTSDSVLTRLPLSGATQPLADVKSDLQSSNSQADGFAASSTHNAENHMLEAKIKVKADTPSTALTGVLTGSQILEEGLVVDPDLICLKGASYDLRLGAHVVMCGTGRKEILDLSTQSVEVVTIPPFGTIIFETLEVISTRGKRNIVGQIGLRVTLALEGLILQLGPQIDPGYRGKLFGLLLNTSTEPKELRYRDKILTVQFCYTSRPLSEEEYRELDGDGIKAFLAQKNIRWERIARENVIQSLQTSVAESLETVINMRDDVYKVMGLHQAVQQNKWGKTGVILGVVAIIISIVLWYLEPGGKDADEQPDRTEHGNVRLNETTLPKSQIAPNAPPPLPTIDDPPKHPLQPTTQESSRTTTHIKDGTNAIQ